MAGDSPLCRGAELFRTKLIDEFNLLESIGGGVSEPVYDSSQVTDGEILRKMLLEAPHQLIKFKVYRHDGETAETNVDRRLTRVKNKNKLPLGVWARSVVEAGAFQHFMLALIVVNSIALGIQSELTDAVSSGEDSLMALVVILDMFDYFCLFWFVIEIILKWIDDFRMFWKNGWNIFDFLITGLSAAPEVITLFSGNENSPIAETARQLRVFRVLRSLKMVSRFGSLKIIVLTILQTFKTMAFLMLLLFTVAFIFAIVAIVVFEPLSSSERTDLEYKDSFKGLPRSLVTLFQLFTLDHWYDIYVDVTKVVNPTLTIIFIIAWIWVGAFVFRNIFVGIMVNNFTTISEALQEQTLDERKHMEMEKKRETLNLDIMKQEARRQSETLTRPAAVQSRHTGYKSFASTICSEYTTKQFQLDEKESDGWAKTVRDNLQTLAFHLEETRWPRDSLFRLP